MTPMCHCNGACTSSTYLAYVRLVFQNTICAHDLVPYWQTQCWLFTYNHVCRKYWRFFNIQWVHNTSQIEGLWWLPWLEFELNFNSKRLFSPDSNICLLGKRVWQPQMMDTHVLLTLANPLICSHVPIFQHISTFVRTELSVIKMTTILYVSH